jgi:hypothetical protein
MRQAPRIESVDVLRGIVIVIIARIDRDFDYQVTMLLVIWALAWAMDLPLGSSCSCRSSSLPRSGSGVSALALAGFSLPVVYGVWLCSRSAVLPCRKVAELKGTWQYAWLTYF